MLKVFLKVTFALFAITFLFALLYFYSKSDMKRYAQELQIASRPNQAVVSFCKETENIEPIRRTSLLYQKLQKNWLYVPDQEGQDHFQSVGNIFDTQIFKGDCEDFSASMMSICRVLGLTSLVCLGEYENSGHAWLEIRINQSDTLKNELKETIEREFGNTAKIVKRKQSHWLQLTNDSKLLDKYMLTHQIDTAGILHTIKTQSLW